MSTGFAFKQSLHLCSVSNLRIFFVFQLRTFKVGFSGPKLCGAFEKQAPGCCCLCLPYHKSTIKPITIHLCLPVCVNLGLLLGVYACGPWGVVHLGLPLGVCLCELWAFVHLGLSLGFSPVDAMCFFSNTQRNFIKYPGVGQNILSSPTPQT